MRITKLEQVDGHWRARITIDGETVPVDRRFGSWRITPDSDDPHAPYRTLKPEFASALQAKVRPLERKTIRAQQAA